VVALHPAGSRPINADCGSEHPDGWLASLAAGEADVGFAFDGDADRVLVAADGLLLDGDDLLSILAADLSQRGLLPGKAVVATVMSNLGLEERLASLGLALERTDVGDRHVAQRMRALHAPLGGEASGHVVIARPLPSGGEALLGDALVAGVRTLQAARRLGRSLAELRALRPRHPQRLVNVRAAVRRELADWPELRAAVAAEERRLAGRGRVLVRWSGTEPLLRLMVEARDLADLETSLARLESVARAGLA
jgi:phosphoglucosamine mutase